MGKERLSCVDCAVRACRGKGGEYPPFCLTTHLDPALRQEALDILSGPENAITVAAARNEHESYGKRSRIEETLHLARLLGVKKLGVATCVGLLNEARQLARIFRAQGYEVYGVACKCGAARKSSVGVPEECESVGPNLCNPVLQALILNREGTELNVALGLCVGHDSLFYKYSQGYVTTLIAKDRLLGHNPAAPLYLLDGYWKRLLEEDPYLQPETF